MQMLPSLLICCLCVSRLANRSATLCFWDTNGEKIQQVFARQALTMIFDTVEGNPFSEPTGNFVGQTGYLVRVMEYSIACPLLWFAAQEASVNTDAFFK